MQPPLSECRSYKWKPPNLISLQFGEGGGRQSEGPLQQSREALVPEFGGLLLRERLRPRLPAVRSPPPPPPERELQQPPALRGLPAAARRKVGEKAARTLRQWRTQVRFEIPAEIPTDYENLMFRLP